MIAGRSAGDALRRRKSLPASLVPPNALQLEEVKSEDAKWEYPKMILLKLHLLMWSCIQRSVCFISFSPSFRRTISRFILYFASENFISASCFLSLRCSSIWWLFLIFKNSRKFPPESHCGTYKLSYYRVFGTKRKHCAFHRLTGRYPVQVYQLLRPAAWLSQSISLKWFQAS